MTDTELEYLIVKYQTLGNSASIDQKLVLKALKELQEYRNLMPGIPCVC